MMRTGEKGNSFMKQSSHSWVVCWAFVAFLTVATSAGMAQGPPEPPKASAGSLFGAAANAKSVVTLQAQFTAPAAGQSGRLWIKATIAPGWHIYSITQPPGGPLATKIEVSPPPGVRLAGQFQSLAAPEKKQEPAFDNLTVESHHGTVTWFVPLEFAAGVDPAKLEIRGKVSVQACDAQSCLPPQDVPFVAALGPGLATPGETTSSRPGPAAPAIEIRAVLVQLAFAFLGGLILNVMPCVLPVISLKILAFLEQGGESRGRVFLLNVWYSVGLISVFMVLAALAATVGFAWGEQFTLTWFKVAMTAVVFVMALSFLGVWEIPIPGFVGAGRAGQLQTKEGPSGAFFKGVFATLLATPCSGPFLGPVFGYVLKQPPAMAYGIFAAVGLGMASPYLVIGAFPNLIRFLPRPGAWMETVQQFMGFLLLATVVYLFNTLSPRYFVPTLALLVGLWFACWWIGRTPLTATLGQWLAARVGGLGVAALVGLFAFTILLQESKIVWQRFSPQALETARAEGKTVMVDFTANWCPNCKTNSKFAIETEAVAELVKTNGVVPLLADWTDQSPMIKKALHDLGCNSIPVLAIWPSEPQSQPMVLSDLLQESQVLDALKHAGPSRRR
jgi:thiol:disulfide interchange protein